MSNTTDTAIGTNIPIDLDVDLDNLQELEALFDNDDYKHLLFSDSAATTNENGGNTSTQISSAQPPLPSSLSSPSLPTPLLDGDIESLLNLDFADAAADLEALLRGISSETVPPPPPPPPQQQQQPSQQQQSQQQKGQISTNTIQSPPPPPHTAAAAATPSAPQSSSSIKPLLVPQTPQQQQGGIKRQNAAAGLRVVTPSKGGQPNMMFPIQPGMFNSPQSPPGPLMSPFNFARSPMVPLMPGSPFSPMFNPAMFANRSPNAPHSAAAVAAAAAAATFSNPLFQHQLMQQQQRQQQQKKQQQSNATIDTSVNKFDLRTKWPKCIGSMRLKMFVHNNFKKVFLESVQIIRAKGDDGSVRLKAYIISDKPQMLFIFFYTGTSVQAVGTVQVDQSDIHVYHLLKNGLVQSYIEVEDLHTIDPSSNAQNFFNLLFYIYIPRETFAQDERLLDMADMDEEDDIANSRPLDVSGEAFAKYMSPRDRQLQAVKKLYMLSLLTRVERKGKALHTLPGFIASLGKNGSTRGKKPKKRKLDDGRVADGDDDDDEDDDDDLSDLSDVDDDELDAYIDFNGPHDDGNNIDSVGEKVPAPMILPEDLDIDPELARCLGSITQVIEDEDDGAEEDDSALVIDTPKGMTADLRHYQKIALAWMLNKEKVGMTPEEELQRRKLHPLFLRKRFVDGHTFYYNATHGMLSLKFRLGAPEPKGGILADQMGLGKTVEIIALLVSNPSDLARAPRIRYTKDRKLRCKATLVVAPLTIVDQWKDEIERHTRPSLSVHVYQGSRRIRELEKLLEYDVVVTTYNTLSNEFRDMERKGRENMSPLFQLCFHRIVLDEAHNIKNPNSQQAKAVTYVAAERRWAVTGTPIQNHIDDLFSLFRFVRVEPHGDHKWWNKYVSKPFEKDETRAQAVSTLDVLIRDLILRRTKSKTINGKKILDLPKKHVHLVKLKLSKGEEEFYLKFHRDSKEEFEGLIREDNAMKNYASILQLLLYLRQICCHPSLVLSSYMKKRDNATIRRSLGEFCQNQPPAVRDAVFPMMPKVLEAVDSGDIDLREYLRQYWRGSTKINALARYLNEIKHSTKSVIFSQWTSMLDLVQIAMDKNGIRCARLDGTMSRVQREEAVQTFKNDPNISACLVSLKVGGVGLNLVWATHVFLLDPWWNPAVEEQAIDRVHRIGQNKEVTVIRFIVKDSVEERILELQKRKNEIVQDTIEESSSGGLTVSVGREGTKIGLDDFKRLFDITSSNSSADDGYFSDLGSDFSGDDFGGLADDEFFQDMEDT